MFFFSFFSFQSLFLSSLLFLFSFVISIMFHLHLVPTPFVSPYCFTICFVSLTISWCLVVLLHVLLLHLTLLFCITPHLIALCSTTPLLLYFVTYCFTSPCYLASCFVTCYFTLPYCFISRHTLMFPFPTLLLHLALLLHLTLLLCFASHPFTSLHTLLFHLTLLLLASLCCFLPRLVAS